MDNKEFGKQLEERTKVFAVSVIKFLSLLPNVVEAKVVRYQLAKSATSIGANYSEANRGRSKAEFSHKIKICESETNETKYWLELIERLEWVNNSNSAPIMKEVCELLAIFTSISNKLK